jgi:hypothetical protein
MAKTSEVASIAADNAEGMMLKAAPVAIDGPLGGTPYFPWDSVALWFLIGGISTILIYIIYQWIRNKIKKE